MAFKFVVLALFVAAANAGLIAQHAPLAYHAAPVLAAPVAKAVDPDYDPHPQYSYAYDVQDGITGDSKGQQETRDGDVVHGSYNLVEADGTRRIVDYTADPVNGFNAVVRKEPAGVAVKAVAAAPVAYAAPAAIAKVHAAPVAYAAPTHYAAPAYTHTTYSVAPAIAKIHAPVAYAAPAHYAAPAYATYAKVHAAAPVAYAAPAAYSLH